LMTSNGAIEQRTKVTRSVCGDNKETNRMTKTNTILWVGFAIGVALILFL